MRRWNGWGDDTLDYPMLQSALDYLEDVVGEGTSPQDITLAEVVKIVPESRLYHHSLVSLNPVDRIRHARGQSFPDWLAVRSGRIRAFPDGVAFPSTDQDVHALIEYGRLAGAVEDGKAHQRECLAGRCRRLHTDGIDGID